MSMLVSYTYVGESDLRVNTLQITKETFAAFVSMTLVVFEM